jgi:hypothetical protein
LRVNGCNAKTISRGIQKLSIVTLGRRPYAMVVRLREAPGSSEGVRTIVGRTAGQPGVGTAFRFAYAAGATLILARSGNQ